MKFRRSPEAVTLSDDQARSLQCIRNMSAALVLAHTGTEFDDGVMEAICGDVACVAEELDLSPDDVQRLLVLNEPSLAVEA